MQRRCRAGAAALLLQLLGLGTAAAGSSDLSRYRTNKVATSFDTSKLDGLWYEVAYHDPAMAGASCPTIQNTANTSNIEMLFSVKYGPLPFSMNLTYLPDGDQRGLFRRHKEGLGSSIVFECAIVDFAEASDGSYAHYIELTAVAPSLGVWELRFVSRSPHVDKAALDSMNAVVRQQDIVPRLVGSLQTTNWGPCGLLPATTHAADIVV